MTVLFATTALSETIISQFPAPTSAANDCLPYTDFNSQIAAQGARLSTIEVTTSPHINRMTMATFEDSKDVSGGLHDCVPSPLFVDAPNDNAPAIFDPADPAN